MEDAYEGIENVPSMKVRLPLSEKDGIDDKAFKTRKSIQERRTLGILKLLLPSWKLPEVANIKQLFKIVEELDTSTSEKEFPSISIKYPLEKLREVRAVAKSIVLSAKHCAPYKYISCSSSSSCTPECITIFLCAAVDV